MAGKKKQVVLRYPSCGDERQDQQDVERRIEELAPKGVEVADLPLVSWSECGEKGCFRASLLCRTRDCVEIHDFFCEMLRRWLVPGRSLPLTEARMWSFKVGKQEFLLSEATVRVGKAKDAVRARENFPLLTPEIKLGAMSTTRAWTILQARGLPPQRKVDLMHQAMLGLLRRHPDAFDATMLEDVQHFLLLSRPEYREIREVRHLCRIIYSLYLLRKEVRKDHHVQGGRRHLQLRVMRASLSYAFGEKQVLGVALAVTAIPNYELLEEEHLAKGVKHLVPRLRVVEDSYLTYQPPKDAVRAVYFEVETADGTPPTGEELTQLRKELAGELRGRVERLTHSVFSPRNEEEIFRTVMALGQELRYVRDLPQISLVFRGQGRRTMTWKVIVVRLWVEDQPTLEELAERLPAGVQFVLEEEILAGHLRKKYHKKASVFTLNFDREPFLRRDSSVDLPRARQFVVRLLTGMLGEVRDFTGGLMIKQREVLSATRSLLAPHEQRQDFLLENLFYSITPAVMQSYLDPQLVKGLFQLMLEMREAPISRRDGYIMRSDKIEDARLVLVRSEDRTFRGEVEGAVGALGYEVLEIATARLHLHGSYYLGYICPTEEGSSRRLMTQIEGALKRWAHRLQSEQSIRINLPRVARSFDPRRSVDRRSGILMKMLYEGLMRLDEQGKPVPGVAESYEISADGLTYTFHLRPCRWTNGEPVTAGDFEYTWKTALEPSTGLSNRFAYFLFPVKGARAAKEGRIPISEVGVRSEGERKLVVELECVAPYFLESVSHWLYLPLYRGIDDARPGSTQRAGSDLVCNGPFRIASAPVKGELKLVKNGLYWDESVVQLDRVEILSIDDPYTAMVMFETGNLDWVGEPLCSLPTATMPALKRDPRMRTDATSATFRVDFNVETLPFSNKKIRQAFACAIDRQRLIDEVLGCGEVAARDVTPPMWEGKRRQLVDDADPKRARKLLAEGLRELEMEALPPITFYHPIFEDQGAVTKAIAEQWKEALGVEVSVEGLPWKSYPDYVLSRETQVVAVTWYTLIADSFYNFEAFRHRDGGFNTSRWENSEYRETLAKVDELTDPKERLKVFARLEDILAEEVPFTPIYFHRFRYLSSPRVKGGTVLPVGQLDFKKIYIDRGEGKK